VASDQPTDGANQGGKRKADNLSHITLRERIICASANILGMA
jgi:hypothetical protein